MWILVGRRSTFGLLSRLGVGLGSMWGRPQGRRLVHTAPRAPGLDAHRTIALVAVAHLHQREGLRHRPHRAEPLGPQRGPRAAHLRLQAARRPLARRRACGRERLCERHWAAVPLGCGVGCLCGVLGWGHLPPLLVLRCGRVLVLGAPRRGRRCVGAPRAEPSVAGSHLHQRSRGGNATSRDTHCGRAGAIRPVAWGWSRVAASLGEMPALPGRLRSHLRSEFADAAADRARRTVLGGARGPQRGIRRRQLAWVDGFG